ncbi:PQQ-like beta-propeller repeat protein [Stieleria sp. JC731]|uniref:outer membrane protein assembly factor BamB family protein n=1 Tax=Pirellulaceae TaxID=2691357 RepID=UPI001E34FE89|nr:PQQ-binding-like beta-propeller repeat protein [Stieleria sp. JC731]MCC9599251.1 PQQ-like beta-propeller repeat protein [Stieleria sp. JC731]
MTDKQSSSDMPEEASISQDEHSHTDDTNSASPTETSTASKLRTWPAWILLTIILALLAARKMPTMALSLMMASFLGPAIAGVFVILWWCFASRGSVKEKVIGTLGFFTILGVAIVLLDQSMKDMATMVMVIPTAVLAFLVSLILFAAKPQKRVHYALVASAVFVSYWETQQLQGLTGRFESEMLWRWAPTPEEQYLAELKKRDDTAVPSAEPISFASAPWPSFRGPKRDGVLHGVSLQEDWQANPPNEVWRQKIGPGWSSFAIGGDRLFTQEQRAEDEAIICLDANTGQQIWEFTYPSRFWEAIGGAGPRATPTIIENALSENALSENALSENALSESALYAVGADGIVLRLDPNTGTEVWRRDLKEDAKRSAPPWGFSSSPLVIDNNVIVHAGGKDDLGLLAYDSQTGDIAWKAPSGSHSYSSPQLATIAGTEGILMLTNFGVDFHSPSTGEVIWSYEWKVENYRALQPLVVDSSVYLATALQDGTRKITVSKSSDDGKWSTAEDWTSLQMKPDFNDFVYHKGNIYGFDGSVFACIDAETGERQWKRGRYGNGQVLLLADSDQLLIMSEKGEIVLAKATPDRLTELAKIPVLEGKSWNHPVVVGNKLYVRNAREIACFELPLQ